MASNITDNEGLIVYEVISDSTKTTAELMAGASTAHTQLIQGALINRVSDNEIKINTNTQAIANLATAQGVFSNTTGLVLTATEQNLPFTVDVPSTDSNVMVIDDSSNHITFNITAAYNFKTDMNFAVNTPQARTVTIRGRRVSDGQLIYSRTIDILQANGTTKSVSTNTLLILGKNGVPSAPFDIYFTIQCSDTGISMIDFTSLLASSTSIYTQRGIDTLTASGTISSANSTVFINVSSNSVFTLADATEASGLEINIKRIDTTGSNVVIDTTGVQTIDGNGSVNILPLQNIRVISNGTNWYII